MGDGVNCLFALPMLWGQLFCTLTMGDGVNCLFALPMGDGINCFVPYLWKGAELIFNYCIGNTCTMI